MVVEETDMSNHGQESHRWLWHHIARVRTSQAGITTHYVLVDAPKPNSLLKACERR